MINFSYLLLTMVFRWWCLLGRCEVGVSYLTLWYTKDYFRIEFIQKQVLTLARLMSSSWPALMFSFLPPHARSTEAWRARPYENVRAHGLKSGTLLMAFKWIEASSSDWPPDKNVTPEINEQTSMQNQHKSYVRYLLSCTLTGNGSWNGSAKSNNCS